MDEMLLRAREVSAALRLGRSKVYEMMASGQLPVVRVGRAVRVPRAALEKWVRRQTVRTMGDGDGGDAA